MASLVAAVGFAMAANTYKELFGRKQATFEPGKVETECDFDRPGGCRSPRADAIAGAWNVLHAHR